MSSISTDACVGTKKLFLLRSVEFKMVNEYTTVAIATVGVASSVFAGYKIYQRLAERRLPQEWKQVGTLRNIYAYPIKSCGPVILDKAEISLMGVRNGWLRDRTLMVVNDQNTFVTARQYPELLTAHPSVKSSVLTVTHKGMDPLRVNLAEIIESNPEPMTAEVWNTPVPVYDCGYEANQWFTRLLNKPESNFKLVYYASYKSRSLRPSTSYYYKWTKNDSGALPDEVSFNLINEASVQDLNSKLEDPITHRNFRPNFVLKGATPYDEDTWKYIKIGENVFEIIKPCGRCVLTTIDPETGVRSPKGEPLTTLRSYRQFETPEERRITGTTPRMGIQMALRSGPGGLVSLDDPIYVA